MKNIKDHFTGNEKGAAIIYRYLGISLAFRLMGTGITPNQLTVAGFLAGLGAACLFAQGSHRTILAGALLYQLCIIIDYSDGSLARLKDMTSYMGRWLEYCLDAIREFFIIFGISWGLFSQTQDPRFWILGFILCGTNYIMDTEEQCFTTFPFVNQGIRAFAPKSKLYEIGKHFVSIRTTRYLAILIFVVINRMDIYLIFFSIYNTLILLLMTFLLGRKVYHQDRLKAEAAKEVTRQSQSRQEKNH